jgi:hypothetical protein
VLIAAFVFGLLASWIESEDGSGIPELRNALGNVSAPWLLGGRRASAATPGSSSSRSAWSH